MINKLKVTLTLWYRKLFWNTTDHWAHLYGLSRKRFESDKKLTERILGKLRNKGGRF